MQIVLTVQMERLPCKTPEKWQEFLKPNGQRIPLSPKQIERCQSYMRSYRTDALSEDAMTAFTIEGNALVECLPDSIGEHTDDGE
jgi:hypothetical protein